MPQGPRACRIAPSRPHCSPCRTLAARQARVRSLRVEHRLPAFQIARSTRLSKVSVSRLSESVPVPPARESKREQRCATTARQGYLPMLSRRRNSMPRRRPVAGTACVYPCAALITDAATRRRRFSSFSSAMEPTTSTVPERRPCLRARRSGRDRSPAARGPLPRPVIWTAVIVAAALPVILLVAAVAGDAQPQLQFPQLDGMTPSHPPSARRRRVERDDPAGQFLGGRPGEPAFAPAARASFPRAETVRWIPPDIRRPRARPTPRPATVGRQRCR